MAETSRLQFASMKPHCSEAEGRACGDRRVNLCGMSDMMANHMSSPVPGKESPAGTRMPFPVGGDGG
jgi:hypothetical protein